MNKRMTIMVILLIIVFGGIIGFNVIKSVLIKRFFAHYQVPAVTVSAITTTEQDWKAHINAVGNFIALNGVDVNAQASGNVTRIHFTSGQYVTEGQLLIDIDDSIEQATLKFNQANLTLRQMNYKRQTELFTHHATAAISVDEAKALMLEAEANIEKTQSMIAQKHIRSPFAGKLGIRQINLGQYIRPGQTAIVALQSMDPIYLEFYLPEQLTEELYIDQPLTFSVEQNPGLLFTGKITALNSKIDTNTHTIQVQASLPNCSTHALNDLQHSTLIKTKQHTQDNKTFVFCDTTLNTQNQVTDFNFIPGMFAAIQIEKPSLPHTIAIPTTAISYTLYGNSVFVINTIKDPSTNGQDLLTVKRVFIETGDQQGNYTVIKKGLHAGQRIVASGEMKLQDGTRVTINNQVPLPDITNPAQLGQ